MHRSFTHLSAVALSFILGSSVTLLAQDKPADKPPAQPPAMQADQAAMMEAWTKAMQPGPNHDLLKPLIGEWQADVKFKMAPDAPEQTSSGFTKNELFLGGRFIKQDYGGDFMGQPFHGLGLIGYDNVKKKFIAVWADEMSTSIIMAEGTADAAGKVITFNGSYPDPMSGQTKQYKQVTRITDDSKHVSTWYELGPDGKEFVNMEITYTKKK